ncbi:efflux RND transporter periplasmic adaptor subunit [Pseudodesulfovibrio sp. zrk46]|uniref:efflux RND transporter periplasmic adaptor subunit n=1 Tax=Pseudodesulfovibrio sp. zrk46 TaxID=2725288 RepID=UPI0014492C39|nr:efflux RND transporter periplasmic adaptor subunit [Pseudodesulfovibrio sp. zrk46]QJB55625.1 efflux RND transporter periplasmic adaptor subunit [Pseudodesulfovibrio sp. zrk46]
MTIFTRAKAAFSLKVMIPAVIIVLAAVGAYAMVATAPKAKKRAPVASQPTVETATVTKENHRVWVPVMGTVTAAREITLKSRVSGDVASVSNSFVPGGYFAEGEEILTLSPEDYELALSEVQADVTNAEYALKVEQGYQNVSAREWKLLQGSTKASTSESELALRKPHLEKAKADVRAAKAQLKQAQLNLDRTHIRAPFAAMVQTKDTDIGDNIASQEALATLVGTDEFWIEASVPVDRLDWIELPVNGHLGAEVRITSGSGGSNSVREGRVVRLLPSLEDEGRMARLLISVNDPLNLEGKPGIKPLLLGSYVSVQIDGGVLADVYAIPRSSFRENNKVWVLTDKGTLDIRSVNPVWRDGDTLVLDEGLADGESLVVSNLSAAVQGMKVRSATAAPTDSGEPAMRAEKGDEARDGEGS